MPTLSELAGAKSPPTDGLSFLPTLMSQPDQPQHAHLYWEFNGQVAVRQGKWKAYRTPKKDWQLYDLSVDIEEKNNVAAEHSEVLQDLITLADESHEPVKPGEIYDHELAKKDRH